MQLQIACDARERVPTRAQVESWASTALKKAAHPNPAHRGEVTIRVVDRAEMTDLNHRYRGKRGATNVLSFPFETIEGLPLNILGDIVICAPIVAEQAAAQHQPLMHHWAHMVIHGILHLCGFDHQQTDDAERMELLERNIMAECEQLVILER